SSLIDDVAYLLLVLRLRGPAEGVSPPLPPLRGPLDVLRLPDLPSLAVPLLLRLPLSPALRASWSSFSRTARLLSTRSALPSSLAISKSILRSSRSTRAT